MAPFCDAMSVLLALKLASGSTAATSLAEDVAAAQPASHNAVSRRQTRFERLLLQHNASLGSLRKSSLANAAIGVVKLPDWPSVASQQPGDAGGRTAMDAILEVVRETIQGSDIGYAALLDDLIVLAAFSGDEAHAPHDAALMATAMLQLRDRLTRLEEKWSVELDFRLAMDVGTVMTSPVASDPPSRNLWGGAVGIARILAASAARHTVAASESAYELLGGQFLFRPRGSYFLPETGNMRTFIVVGRL
jgi:hypothetical protein